MKKTHGTRNIIPEKIIIDGMNPILIVFGLINKVKKNETKSIKKRYPKNLILSLRIIFDW